MSDSNRRSPALLQLQARMMRSGPARPGRFESAHDPRRALSRLLPYLKPMASRLVVVFALIIASTLSGLAGPWLMGKALDLFIRTGDLAGLGSISLSMLAIFLAANAFDLVSGWIMAGVSQKALRNLRNDLFDHLHEMPIRFFDANPAGELMSRLTNDIDAVNQAVSQNIITLFGSVLGMAGILAAMFALNAWLALASLAVMPLMFWFAKFVSTYTRKGFRELQKRLGTLNGVMEEAISGQRISTAFGKRGAATDAFRMHNREVYEAAVYANTYAMLLMPLTNQLGNLFVIVVAGVGGFLALRGIVTAGIILTFISYGRNFVSPLRQIANVYNALQGALAGAERVFEIIDSDPEIADPEDAAALGAVGGHVTFDRVSFGYETGRPVIRDMSLDAKPGETVALVGPTGAGKTTIVNLLSRFYEIDSGAITIDGVDVRHVRREELRKALGIVLQDTFLFQASVIENIRYGRIDASDGEVMEAAVVADADHFIRQLPQGYGTILSERATNLSQGQRQLIAIARAVLSDPGILILDEATASIDTRTERHIQASLLRLMKGRTSFVIAHRLSTIRDADRILVIRDGEICERGSYDELMAAKGFFHHLYMSQFKGEEI
ncbi:MAG: ABC transporter ATP-binding protein [Spirochaetes bacterium]|nr:ABC transporter ATP-binding protein [Spirochaetota bacterium]